MQRYNRITLPPVSRLIVGWLLFLMCVGPMHEMGHFAFAQFSGITVLGYELSGLNPHITVVVSNFSIQFLLAGQLFMPIYFFAYCSVFEISRNEKYMYLIALILGSLSDINNILYLVTSFS